MKSIEEAPIGCTDFRPHSSVSARGVNANRKTREDLSVMKPGNIALRNNDPDRVDIMSRGNHQGKRVARRLALEEIQRISEGDHAAILLNELVSRVGGDPIPLPGDPRVAGYMRERGLRDGSRGHMDAVSMLTKSYGEYLGYFAGKANALLARAEAEATSWACRHDGAQMPARVLEDLQKRMLASWTANAQPEEILFYRSLIRATVFRIEAEASALAATECGEF